ncbi:MAG: hypothetical protein ACRCS3_07975 [Paracoccaceae bacterium]
MKRPIRIDGAVAYIPLTQGYEAIIDAVDVPLVEDYNWYAKLRGHAVYAMRTSRDAHGKNQTTLLHRAILPAPSAKHIDHISGDGLDNRRANIRAASPMQNSQNQKLRKDNTSGFKGVYWNKLRRAWLSRIGCGGEKIHLGYFPTAKAAHAAYCKASKRLHGKFGRVA